MKVAATVAAHDFQLTVDGLHHIGGGEGFPHRFGVTQESQVVRPFLAEFADPGGIGLGEAIAEFFELTVTLLDIPGRYNRTPALLKLDGIGLGKMSLSIALHVNRAQLDVGVSEEALADG